MIGYKQLLASIEWQEKRKNILRRDNNNCQRCGISHKQYQNTYNGRLPKISKSNLHRIEITKTSNFKSINLAKVEVLVNKYIICKTSLKREEISDSDELILSINFGLKDRIKYPFNGSTIENLNDNYFLSSEFRNTGLALLNSSPKIKDEVDIDEFEIDKEGIWLTNSKEAHKVNKSPRLQVHHKCYRKGIEIWAQDDDEYVSLCNICHRIIHENQFIPYYNEFGKIYQLLVPCWKCSGQRYFELYRHRDNGICYCCGGKGFNENRIKDCSNVAPEVRTKNILSEMVIESMTVIEFMKKVGYISYIGAVFQVQDGVPFMRFNINTNEFNDIYFSEHSHLVINEDLAEGDALEPEYVEEHFRVAQTKCNNGYEWKIISNLDESSLNQ